MNNPTTMTLFDLAILYRIMMKRIAKNLSSLQLSFLIGKPDDYVGRVEMLELDFYSAEDISNIAFALEDEDVASYYSVNTDETLVSVEMVKEYIDKNCLYTCNVCRAGEAKQTYFTLTDDSEYSDLTQQDMEEEISLANSALSLLIEADYFYEARTAIEPYMAINQFLGRKLSLDAIKNSLKEFCFAEVPLVGMVEIGNARFAYQQP